METYVQPNYATQSGSAYPTGIDKAMAVLAEVARQGAAHEATVPNFTVIVDPLRLGVGYADVIVKTAQTVSGFSAATSGNQRIDRVVVNMITGVATRITGVNAASPVAPQITEGNRPCAQILFTDSSTAVTNSMITDERPLFSDSPLPDRSIGGFIPINNVSDPNNDIDILEGSARSRDNTANLIALLGGMTKRQDALWSVGSNGGAMLQSANLAGTITTAVASPTVTGSGTSFTTAFTEGDVITSAGGTSRRIVTVNNASNLTVESNWGTLESGVTYKLGGLAPNTWYNAYAILDLATRVVDYLFSTRYEPYGSFGFGLFNLPAGYGAPRRIFSFHTNSSSQIERFFAYETAGGGLHLLWDSPHLDIDLAATLTTTEREDTLSAPSTFSVEAEVNVLFNDAAINQAYIHCPDTADLAPSATASPLMSIRNQVAAVGGDAQLRVRTSATGTIASRASVATVDNYRVATLGWHESRR